MQRTALTFVLLLVASVVGGSEPSGPRRDPAVTAAVSSMQLSLETRHVADNTDGSCVQCSLTHCGYHSNVPAAARLLVDSQYGPAVRGGSTPTRVASYCNARHIEAYNITGTGDGRTTGTLAWMRYAVKTGRYAAIGAGRQHFQTLWGYDSGRQRWLVVNNQLPTGMRVDEYTEEQFIRLHMESGPWIVVLKRPSSENPTLDQWWE